ncbi:MAG: DUF192 domain-containing protein [Anaerolineae bacterium]|nr:DUF192 domain-containing protein [Anaerolineae bacterium]
MAEYVSVVRADGTSLPLRVKKCDSFVCRLRGLTFRRRLGQAEGLLFVGKTESRWGAAIHMFFVFFSIGVVWLDSQCTVVDAKIAHPFAPFYAPCGPARYFLEGPTDLVGWVTKGERLQFE